MSNLDSIFNDDWSEDFRSGLVAVVGRPNVGKSTLINGILGQKIAIVSPKPQTTRTRQLGIYSTDKCQMIFVDTPGIHVPHHKLGTYMVSVAEDALKDADVILWIVDSSEAPQAEDRQIAETIQQLKQVTPIVLALNKMDLVEGQVDFSEHLDLVEYESMFQISAETQAGVSELLEHLLTLLSLGPPYYPTDDLSDANLRFIAAEIIREKIILNTAQEIPHSVAVEVTEFKEKENISIIEATIYVERDSQKGIIIGKGGKMIKRIGMQSREDLEVLMETQVHLDTRVKVLKNWRKNEDFMKRLGYSI